MQEELYTDPSILQGPAPMPTVRIPSPGDPSAYFAPISPAAKTSSEPHHATSLLNMLRAGAAGKPELPEALLSPSDFHIRTVPEILAVC